MFDFYSDTKTKPTAGMRRAIAEAEVGDEQKGEDPTTNALCARVAEMLEKEAAVYLPSGTMCNEIAIRVHCRPGDEVICEATSHIINFEGGGPAALSGVMIRAIEGDHGVYTGADIEGLIRGPSRYDPDTALICVEQTANLGGGAVWAREALDSVTDVADTWGIPTHMDGARLMNACAAAGVAPGEFTRRFTSCWVDFSKGLGAPVGAVLAGTREFIEEAWRYKQQWGGAMRQSGIIAAACLYALDHHVERLADDHALAKRIAGRLQDMPGIAHVLPVETNIVYFDVADGYPDASDVTRALEEQDIIVGAFTDRRIRLVTHLDVDEEAGNRLCEALGRLLA